MLVEAMIVEHKYLVALVQAIKESSGPVRAAASAQALRTLFESHLVKENEQILPLLAESSGVSLAEILGGMHELLGGHGDETEVSAAGGAAAGTTQGGCGGQCGCGHQDPAGELPVLDGRA
jgi:Hemerythrin HHE cation binding domain